MAKAQEVATTTEAPPPSLLENYAITEADLDELGIIMREAFGAIGPTRFDLQQLHVPSGESAGVWQVPTLEGDPELVKVLECVVLSVQHVRSYWKVAYAESGGGSPPDCSSVDGVIGQGKPGGECIHCPLAAFGSATNRGETEAKGQACKDMRLLFVMLPSSAIPHVVVAPPTSIKQIREFIVGVAGLMRRISEIKTGLTLEQDKSGDGFPYWKIVPKLMGKLEGPERELAKTMAGMVSPIQNISDFVVDERPPYEG